MMLLPDRLPYDKHRLNCGHQPKWADTDAFIEWADDKMLNNKWSPGVVIGFVSKHELFDPTIIPCITTLYYWIAREIIRTKKLVSSRKAVSEAEGIISEEAYTWTIY